MPIAAMLLGLSLTPQAYADNCSGVTNGICDDLAAVVDTETRPSDPLRVSRGQITFDVEGNDDPDSRYFSRVLHWPQGASGVTIGRGYDMRYRTAEQILADLLEAGVDQATAEIMSQGAGLSGNAARDFVRNHSDLIITREAQQALFEEVYEDYSDMTRELVCRWSGSSGAACDTLWDSMDPAIQTTLVDLRYRGDLTRGRWNRMLGDAVLADDLDAFTDIMSNRNNWSSVPSDRFNRRVDFLEEATSAAPLTSIRPTPRPDDLGTSGDGADGEDTADATASNTTTTTTPPRPTPRPFGGRFGGNGRFGGWRR